MKKHIIPAILVVPLLLAGCSSGQEAQSESTTTYSDSDTGDLTGTDSGEESAELADLSEGVKGQVGFRHGLDCEAVDDCSVNFTVESLDRLDGCAGFPFDEQPAETHLVKATVLVETSPSKNDYNPGEFPVWTDWSALDSDGVNQNLPSSSWCSLPTGDQQWSGAMQTGDTERRAHLMDVPDGATKIRMTEISNGARWEFPAP